MKVQARRINKVNDIFLTVAANLVLVAALIPLIMIGRYAHPCADDYSYCDYTNIAWENTHSLTAVFDAAMEKVRTTYDTWQGTFSSIFFMALCPAIWGEKMYGLTPLMMLGSIIFSHFLVLYVVLVKGLKVCRSRWWYISCIFVVWLLQTIHSPVNALYWYNGSVHYTFMHSVMLVALALVWWLFCVRRWWKKLLIVIPAIVVSFICSGSNYSTGLLGLLCLVGMVVLFSLYQKKVLYSTWLPLFCYGWGFYYSISAGGNGKRQGYFEGKGILESIESSFRVSIEFVCEWFGWQTLIILLLLLPVVWNMVIRTEYKFSLPGVVTVLSYCSLACMFTPLFYAMGGAGVDRQTNIAKMWFQLLLLGNFIYWIGWIRRKFGMRNTSYHIGYFTVVVAMLLCHFCLSEHVLTDYTSYAAYVSLRTGEARAFHEEYMARVALLEGSEAVIGLQPYTVKPYLLYFDDITADKYDWRNGALAEWYGKESVYLVEISN